MIYVITENSGKRFIPKMRTFTVTAYPGDVYVLEDSRAAKIWADDQILFNNGKIVTKAEAQAAIDKAFDNRQSIPPEIAGMPSPTKPVL